MHLLTPKEIRSVRLRVGDNPTRFAARLNVSENTVRRWEIGDRHPNYHSLRKLHRLAVKVGMSLRPA